MAVAGTCSTVSLLPLLRQRAFRQAISAFNDADLRTPAGHERVVRDVTRAYADYERRMLPADAKRLATQRIEAIVRVALRDLVAACA